MRISMIQNIIRMRAKKVGIFGNMLPNEDM